MDEVLAGFDEDELRAHPPPRIEPERPYGRPRELPEDHVRVTARLSPDLLAKLDILAKKEGLTRSAMLRQLIDAFED